MRDPAYVSRATGKPIPTAQIPLRFAHCRSSERVGPVISGLSGLGRFDLLFQIDVGDSLVEIDAEAAGLFFLRLGGGAGDAALSFRRGTGNANHVPALGADPLFARVCVANLEGALPGGPKDKDCPAFQSFTLTVDRSPPAIRPS